MQARSKEITMIFTARVSFGITVTVLLAVLPGLAGAAMTHLKSPRPGMHFTQGIPIRMVADGIDQNGWQWLDQQMEAEEVRFYVDGKQAAVDGHTRGYNHFEAVVTGIAAGGHTLTTQSSNYGGVIVNSDSVTIIVDAVPVKATAINLTSDLTLSGSTSLDWQDAIVRGNGFRVTSVANWTGSITIRNCLVTGLGVTSDSVPAIANAPTGITLATTGAVDIQNSVFEWTGTIRLTADGSASITIKNNEFRSSMHIAYVSSDPDRSPFLEIHGSSTGRKLFQGNNIGAGYLYIVGMSRWLIGGSTDIETNVFNGPRTGTYIQSASGDTIRGNYMHHDYSGGWSQGFCCRFESVSNMLVEHTVIRDGSWPLQSMGGEFRYNFIEGCGHEWVRTLLNNTRFHHNILHEAGAGGDPSAGIWMYGNQTGVSIYNNTFDGRIFFPAVSVSNGSSISSLRNNIFNGLTNPASRGIVDRYLQTNSEETDNNARILYTDYNCFYNPQSQGPNNYGSSLVSGITEGSPGWAGHDPGGVNGQANPSFAGGSTIAYTFDESAVWTRTLKLSQVLASLRARYTPNTGSPVIDAGDPADGAGVDIGAVGAGKGDPADLFGKFGTSSAVIKNSRRSMMIRNHATIPSKTMIYDLQGRLVGQTTSSIMQKTNGVFVVVVKGRTAMSNRILCLIGR
jgi:hypothetical protein